MSTTFDWAGLKSRVTEGYNGTLDQAALAQVFRRRAELLAKRTETGADDALRGQYLVFDIGSARCAVALRQIRSILTLNWITRIPGAPEFKSRIAHLEGRIVTLVDLKMLLELGASTGTEHAKRCLLLEHGTLLLGIMINDLRGITRLDDTNLSPAAPSGLQQRVVRGVTPDLTIVLDGPALVTALRDEATTHSY
jgi:purine-binding chemotaxis protein CheW